VFIVKCVFFIGEETSLLCESLLKEVYEVKRTRGCPFTEIIVILNGSPTRLFCSNKENSIDKVPFFMREKGLNPNEAIVAVSASEFLIEKFPFLREETDRHYFFIRNHWQGSSWILCVDGKEREEIFEILFR
jgi:hypothetical protein